MTTIYVLLLLFSAKVRQYGIMKIVVRTCKLNIFCNKSKPFLGKGGDQKARQVSEHESVLDFYVFWLFYSR